MKVIEAIVKSFEPYLNNKKLLEIACGDSEFSLNASKYAKYILATDISLERIKRRNLTEMPGNIQFKEMDAANLDIEDNSYDVSVCYNALAHLEGALENVLTEMTRITSVNGYLIFIVTWKMDMRIIPRLKKLIGKNSNLIEFEEIKNKMYTALIIKKENI